MLIKLASQIKPEVLPLDFELEITFANHFYTMKMTGRRKKMGVFLWKRSREFICHATISRSSFHHPAWKKTYILEKSQDLSLERLGFIFYRRGRWLLCSIVKLDWLFVHIPALCARFISDGSVSSIYSNVGWNFHVDLVSRAWLPV